MVIEIHTEPFVKGGRRVWKDSLRCPLVCIQGNSNSKKPIVCPHYKGISPAVKIERCFRDEVKDD